MLDTDRSSLQEAVYLQHEIKLTRAVIINAGLRYDRYEQFERVTPRAALIVLPSSTQSFKYLYGSAFRAPNENELTGLLCEQVQFLRRKSSKRIVRVERYIKAGCRTPGRVLVLRDQADHEHVRRCALAFRFTPGPVRAKASSRSPLPSKAKNGIGELRRQEP